MAPRPRSRCEFDDRPHGTAARIRLRLDQDVGDGQHALEQIVDAFPGPGAGPHDRHVAAVRLLGNDAALGELLERAIRVHAFLVDLVHRHDDGDTRGVDVLDGLLGLRHDPVIGGHDQDRDVGHVRSAGAHRRERRMARGVDERDQAAVALDLVCADDLGDPARLAGGNLGLADRVEERCLAMVDVAEHRHDRRPGDQRPRSGIGEIDQGVLAPASGRRRVLGRLGDRLLGLRLEAEVVGGERRGVEVDRLVEGGHDPVAHQVLDQLGAGDAEALGEFGDREPCRQGDLLDRGYVDSSMPSSRSAVARVGSSITSSPTRSERARDRCRRDRRRQVIPVSRQRYAPRPGQRPVGSRVTRPDPPVTASRISSVVAGRGGSRCRCASGGRSVSRVAQPFIGLVAPDVDAPAGELGCEARVLTAPADRERELIGRHRDVGGARLGIELDALSDRRDERVHDEGRRVGRPGDDLHLLLARARR